MGVGVGYDQHLGEHNMHSFALFLILSLINCVNVCTINTI